MSPALCDPDTSDLVEPGDSGIQTEPAADLAGVQAYLADRDAWLQRRVEWHVERAPF